MPRIKNEKNSTEEASEESTNEGIQEVLESEGALAGGELSEKETLLALYQTLKDLGINSIGDLEVKISRL